MTSQDDGRNSFVRGMTIGAIIGAIVAGSSLWSRRRRARRVPFEGESAPERLEFGSFVAGLLGELAAGGVGGIFGTFVADESGGK